MFKKLQRSVVVFAMGMLLCSAAFAQTGSLSGTVTEASSGELLPGANVVLQEITKGTATDIDGKYSISNITPGSYTLVASFLGYKRFEQSVEISAGSNIVDINLELDFIGFDDVVVTGTGFETSKKKLGIDVSSVDEQKLTQVPTYDLSSALTGKIAGAQITNHGQPGAPAAIVLRGINTMGSSRPMIMVDGIEIDASTFEAGSTNDFSDRLADIDFNNIERVEVVKGAAAATLYGAQGANGVIQIFTKSGTAGQMQIDASSSVSFDQLNESRTVNQVTDFHSYPTDEDGYITGMSFDEVNGIWTIPNNESNGVVNKPYTGYVNGSGEVVPLSIQDNRIPEFYQTSASRTHNISLSGGNERTQYLVSGNWLDQEGIEPETGFDRLSFRLNSDTDINDDLKLSLRTNYINSLQHGVSESGNNVQSGLNTLLTTEPFIDVFYRNPNGQFPAKFTAGAVSTNPFFFKEIQSLETETNRLIGSTNLNYQPNRFLELDYKLGIDYFYTQFDRVQENGTGYEDPNTTETEIVLLTPEGFVERQGYTNRRINSIVDAFIRTDFQRDFNIDLPVTTSTLLKFDWRRTDYQRTGSIGTGLAFGIPLRTLEAASIPELEEFRSEFITYGFLINQKFEIGEGIGFSGGFRADKSSAFGEAAEYSYFPRGDVYVRISEFDFWDPLVNTVNEFKLRAAYGEAGTQPGAYDRFITLVPGLIGSQGTLGTPATAANFALQVEESQELELGTDLGFRFGDNWFQSLGLSATYWQRENDGTIQELDTAPSMGSGSIFNNAVDLSSEGFDISLNSLVYYNNNLSWLANINVGRSTNTVERIANGEDLTLEPTSGFRYLFREGETYGAFYGFKPIASLNEADPATGEARIPEAERDRYIMYDGAVVNKYNKQIQFRSELEKIGDPTPDFTLTFRNNFQIKNNLDVVFQLDWVQGGDIFNATKWWMFNSGVHEEFQEQVLIDGGEIVGGDMFSGDGTPSGLVSRVDGSQPQAWRNYHASKRDDATPYFVEDGTYLKLREVAISYDFTSLLGLQGVRSLRFGVTGRNLLTLSGYEGFDPEVSGENLDTRYRGLDIFTYPNYRTITFKASIGL